MVRTGVVFHPSRWPFSGYNEIQAPKRKNVLIHYEKLQELLAIDSYDLLKSYHREWVEDYPNNGTNKQDKKWTKTVAVGSEEYIEKIRFLLGTMARGKKIIKAEDSCQLREPSSFYMAHFDTKNEDIELYNTYCWDINSEYSTS